MSKITSTPPSTTTLVNPQITEESAAVRQTQARIIGHSTPSLESPQSLDYLNSVELAVSPVTEDNPRKTKTIWLPSPEQISGWRAYDQQHISYMQAKGNPLITGHLWMADHQAYEKIDFLRWYQITQTIYLPYLLFSEQALLNTFDLTKTPAFDQQAHQIILDRLYLKYISTQVGWGVFAKADWQAGEIIAEYTGVVHTHSTGGTYTMLYQEAPRALNIDARFLGNITRFINHSETPNVQAEKIFSADGISHIIFKVIKTIKINQQLFIDYGPNYWIYQKPQLLTV